MCGSVCACAAKVVSIGDKSQGFTSASVHAARESATVSTCIIQSHSYTLITVSYLIFMS